MGRYIVTGGLGFVGNEVVRQLRNENHEVLIVDNRNRIAKRIADIANVPVVDTDISVEDQTASFRDFRPDSIIHLAAIHYIPECNAEPERTLRVNVAGTQSILKAAEACGAKSVVIASSGAVYANSDDSLTEDHLVEPVDMYGHSKLFCEQLARYHVESTGQPVTAVRLFNVFGPRETNAHIIPEIISQLRKSDTIHLGNIDTKRDYIHVSDAARGFILFAQNPPEGLRIANLTSGNCCTVRELIGTMSEITDRRICVEVDPNRFRKSDKPIQHGDMSKTKQMLDWMPAIGIREGLEGLLKWEGIC